MGDAKRVLVAGVDAGTECLKAVVVDGEGRVVGRAVVAARGQFEACAREALASALDDAQRLEADLTGIAATGFAADCVAGATVIATEHVCQARGAFQHIRSAMTLLDIGGRDPHVITVDGAGQRVAARSVRRCAEGIGSFLMFTARHLDVSPIALQELAAAAARPARISSYCSVFGTAEVLERLREGVPREEIALGSIHSIGERILEMGGLDAPVAACGGVVEYFPGVLHAIEQLGGVKVMAVPEPILTGAVGAALKLLDASGSPAASSAVASA